MQFQPLGDRLLVKPDKEEQVTKGGVVLPDSAQERPSIGHVIAAGPGPWSDTLERFVEPTVKVGDRVYYSRYGGQPIKLEGHDDDLLILRESDVFGVFTDA